MPQVFEHSIFSSLFLRHPTKFLCMWWITELWNYRMVIRFSWIKRLHGISSFEPDTNFNLLPIACLAVNENSFRKAGWPIHISFFFFTKGFWFVKHLVDPSWIVLSYCILHVDTKYPHLNVFFSFRSSFFISQSRWYYPKINILV